MQCLTEIQPEALVVPTARELRMLFTAQKEASWDDHGLQDGSLFPCRRMLLKHVKTD